jgi:hypothetical protein
MSEVGLPHLKHAVEFNRARRQPKSNRFPHEEHDGQTDWDGLIAAFDLAGRLKVTRAYAWSYERRDRKRQFSTVLHVPPVGSRVTPCAPLS